MFAAWQTRLSYRLDDAGRIEPTADAPERLYSLRNGHSELLGDAFLTSFAIAKSYDEVAGDDAMQFLADMQEQKKAKIVDAAIWRAVQPFIRSHGPLGILAHRMLALSLHDTRRM